MTYYNSKKLLFHSLICCILQLSCTNGHIENTHLNNPTLKDGVIINLVGVGCSGCEEAILDMMLKSQSTSYIFLPDNKLHLIKTIKRITNSSYEIVNTASDKNINAFPYVLIVSNGIEKKMEIKTSEMAKIKESFLSANKINNTKP